jgi:hypothetical protein
MKSRGCRLDSFELCENPEHVAIWRPRIINSTIIVNSAIFYLERQKCQMSKISLLDASHFLELFVTVTKAVPD